MKRLITLLLSVLLLFACTACGQQASEEPIDMTPRVSQMKAICELAVMDCYYHNVAKFFQEDAVKGLLGIGNKDKRFWIEYSGIVKLGVDVSLVEIDITGTQVTITLPAAKVLECKVSSATLSKDSYIVDVNSAELDAADEIKAFEEAQARMEETAANDTILLASAQQRAQNLLEEYIANIGQAIGQQYSIKWIYKNASGAPMDSASEAEPQPEEPAA